MWVTLTVVAVTSYLIYFFTKRPNEFWKKYGVPQFQTSFKDNLSILFGIKSHMDVDDVTYKLLQSKDEKYCGFVDMAGPTVLVRDLDILKKVLIKDFDYFVDRRQFFSSKKEPLFQKMIGSLLGEEWKGVRSSVSPTFTTGKIRRMMENFNRVGNNWISHLKSESKNGSFKINANEEITHLTVDVIAASVFGMNANTIQDPKSIFSQMCHRLSDFNFVRTVKIIFSMNFPWLTDLIGMEVMDGVSLRFFEKIMSQGVKSRMSGEEKRNDFIQLIVEARKGELKGVGSDELSTFEKEAQLADETTRKKNYLEDDTIAHAQLIAFFFAGFTTTSSIITFATYALAAHQEVQEKLRVELETKLFKNGDEKDIDYDELNKLPYLDMFLSEVHRKFPPLGRLERKCVKEYHDPESGLRVPKDGLVVAPLLSLHNDPQYFEHPDKFYPEHFNPENKAKRNPYSYMPFGMGPRNCMGMRFALVQTKSAIARLVYNFHLETTPNTPLPMRAKTMGFAIQPPDNLELKLTPRRKSN
ncbi:unnamed protein product [Orchesella dallaii]|uniref:Cytochrome P450 9e2 n=1 Tax=Orchesella dallaii TaxID=48710 RepID=A0ABP1Q885_9HEXA